MKLPGTYAAYAALMAVFGQTIAGVHLGLLLVNGAAILLVYLLGKRLLEPLLVSRPRRRTLFFQPAPACWAWKRTPRTSWCCSPGRHAAAGEAGRRVAHADLVWSGLLFGLAF